MGISSADSADAQSISFFNQLGSFDSVETFISGFSVCDSHCKNDEFKHAISIDNTNFFM
jgi:hypothetical protein